MNTTDALCVLIFKRNHTYIHAILFTRLTHAIVVENSRNAI